MIDMPVEVVVALLPQIMISRPIVVGAVAGWLSGDPATGVTVGVIMELFALESVAIGAARYPDYGAATVGAVVASTGIEGHGFTGIAVVLGLVLASVGGWTLNRLRHANATAVRRREASLRAGDPLAVEALQYGGLLRDVARSVTLSVVAGRGRRLRWLGVGALLGVLLLVLRS